MGNPRIAFAAVHGRPQLVRGGRCHDLASLRDERYALDPSAVFADFDALCDWARGLPEEGDSEAPVFDPESAGPAVPRPRQVFAIGLNYRDHAAEANIPVPKEPMVFTKFASCLAGPNARVALTSDTVDWEVELVMVIGEGGRAIPEAQALNRVAGLCVGQDISDRRRQFLDVPPQFSLGKSAAGFGPLGPAVVPLPDVAHPDDLAIRCEVNGEQMQNSRTSEMIFGLSELVSYLSRHCELYPGDLIFTGTPAGVGSVQKPRRYLKPGDRIQSEIEGVGTLLNQVE